MTMKETNKISDENPPQIERIPSGTPFEELPDDWCCPKCGAEKEFFEELDD
ncbi:MAG: rubredoxin [Deltaproteobacteria bacterium]|nr:rubredoxin [Deltaproteobacteria bacterium]